MKPSGSNDVLESAVRCLLGELVEDPEREGLKETPLRVSRAWRRFTSGYGEDVGAVLGEGAFDDAYEGIVLVRDIDFYSICEHHLVPFFGRCHVAYLPAGRIVGLSKIARVVDIYARRLQVQERMTREIAGAIDRALSPRGVAVRVEAQHLCMMMRGAERDASSVVTGAMLGEFRDHTARAAEFFSAIGRSGA